MFIHYLAIAFISFFCITLELFFTRILNLKTWNHLVYIIIPYAILGYSIGANIVLIFEKYLRRFSPEKVTGYVLLAISFLALVSTYFLIHIPIGIEYLQQFFTNFQSITMLLLAYTSLMLPFVLIGFLVVYLFNTFNHLTPKLYFVDLISAGLGALAFYFLINIFQVIHSIVALALVGMFIALLILYQRWRYVLLVVFGILSCAVLYVVPEQATYMIDLSKGWEVVPGYYKKESYQQVVSRWHPLGRTDIYRMVSPKAADIMYNNNPVTFQLNLKPRPEFSYITTNFLAGSPVYRLNEHYLAAQGIKVDLFSQPVEFPYTVLKNPRVFVIGAGGGRDIFMAKTHGASEVIGAEINPGIFHEMSPGGAFYNYSAGLYKSDSTHVYNVDGRQLVKRQKDQSFDLIILNGVDTFSGLSSGAYAYAESYLYTKEAVVDYLRIVKDNGFINFNRWYLPNTPREDLRLFGLILHALKEIDAQNPGDHVIIGAHDWAMILVKKTPFTVDERTAVMNYFRSHDTALLFPISDVREQLQNPFHRYLNAFNTGKVKSFESAHPFDVSVVTDDSPFFYKYYKFSSFNPRNVTRDHHTGQIVFMTQILVLAQAIVFILLFILFPLYCLRKSELLSMKPKFRRDFIVYFSCLGLGFMFIEIPLMQKFVLILGSPIHSISVILAALLISTGLGSLLSVSLEKRFRNKEQMMYVMTMILISFIALFIIAAGPLMRLMIDLPFGIKVLATVLCLLPFGIILGIYFPSGLSLIGKDDKGAVPWAWAINGGFTVLGSILSIILAQFLGFTVILVCACLIYMLANHAFREMYHSKHCQP